MGYTAMNYMEDGIWGYAVILKDWSWERCKSLEFELRKQIPVQWVYECALEVKYSEKSKVGLVKFSGAAGDVVFDALLNNMRFYGDEGRLCALGKRYNGDGTVEGVSYLLEGGEWKKELQCTLDEDSLPTI